MPVYQLNQRSLRGQTGQRIQRGAVRVFAAATPQQRTQQQQALSRRDVLSIAAASAVVIPLIGQVSPAFAAGDVKSLNPFERSGQRAAFQKMAEDALAEVRVAQHVYT